MPAFFWMQTTRSGLARFWLVRIRLFGKLLAILGLVLAGLTAWILLFAIAAARSGFLWLLGVGHADGACVWEQDAGFHDACSGRVSGCRADALFTWR